MTANQQKFSFKFKCMNPATSILELNEMPTQAQLKKKMIFYPLEALNNDFKI